LPLAAEGTLDDETEKEAVVEKDRIEGKAKELEGKVTGDESREAEGRAQGKWGKAKDKADDAWEDVKDKVGTMFNDREEEKEREQAERTGERR
jgi:uncharacterized protein YjbJ (UPF0337 family)